MKFQLQLLLTPKHFHDPIYGCAFVLAFAYYCRLQRDQLISTFNIYIRVLAYVFDEFTGDCYCSPIIEAHIKFIANRYLRHVYNKRI